MNEIFDFGYRLKSLREKRHLSQTQVAKKLELNRATISSYENNLILPSVEVLTKLALLYRTSTDYLLNLDNRLSIKLDGLNERQCSAIETITDTLIAELKAMQYSKNR